MAAVDRRGITPISPLLNPVAIETTVNLVLSGEQIVNTVALVDGDRVLVKDQVLAEDNGIYIVNTGEWSRSSDFNDNFDIVLGSTVPVLGRRWYELSFSGTLTFGTTELTFTLLTFDPFVSVLNPVLVESDGNLVLSGHQTVNSVAVVTGDRVLVKDQTVGADNGVYLVDSSTWTRSLDFNEDSDVILGTVVRAIGGSSYELSFSGALAIGTTVLSFPLIPRGGLVQVSISEKNNTQVITSAIPVDNTIPQITEGDEVFSINFTAESALNDLIIEWGISCSLSSASVAAIASAFQGVNVDAIGSTFVSSTGVNFRFRLAGKVKVNAGSTAPTAYSVRVGVSSGTATVNNALLGDIPQSFFQITEVKP